MLTPAKIKNHHFEATGKNAYKAESVDLFFEEVSDSYDQMFRENGEMFKKINLLAERLEEYHKDEDNIRATLLTAQRMSDKIVKEADEKAKSVVAYATEKARLEREKAEKDSNEMVLKATNQAQAMIDEAKAKSEKMLFDATNESEIAAATAKEKRDNEETALLAMQREVTRFKKKIMEAYSAQYSLIEQLPEIVLEKLEESKKEEAQAAEEPVEEIKESVSPAEETTEEKEADADAVSVDTLQNMIDENYGTEDEDDEEDYSVDYEEDTDADADDNQDYIIPEVDAVSDSELDKLVNSFSSGVSDEEIASAEVAGSVYAPTDDFVDDEEEIEAEEVDIEDEDEDEEEEPQGLSRYLDDDDDDEYEESAEGTDEKETGFKVNFDNIDAYESEEDFDDDDEDIIYDDEDDDDDDDDDEDDDDDDDGLSSKLKGFFRK